MIMVLTLTLTLTAVALHDTQGSVLTTPCTTTHCSLLLGCIAGRGRGQVLLHL